MVRYFSPPRVDISRCIEFDHCRYDGSYIPLPTVDRLNSFAVCIPACPEVEIGLGVPRATVRILRIHGVDQLIQPSTGRGRLRNAKFRLQHTGFFPLLPASGRKIFHTYNFSSGIMRPSFMEMMRSKYSLCHSSWETMTMVWRRSLFSL
jgi:hypothetical protein